MTRWTTGLGIACLIALAADPARAALIWQDEFARPSSSSVGNGWIEVENDADDVGIVFNHYLLLRDRRPDGEATHAGISTLGYDTITVEFRWRAWSAEGADRLRFSYQSAPILSWETGFDTGLGASEIYRTEVIALDATASNIATLALSFAIDADNYNDAVKLDYVRVFGNAIAAGSATSIAEPAALALAGLGLIGIAAAIRRPSRRP